MQIFLYPVTSLIEKQWSYPICCMWSVLSSMWSLVRRCCWLSKHAVRRLSAKTLTWNTAVGELTRTFHLEASTCDCTGIRTTTHDELQPDRFSLEEREDGSIYLRLDCGSEMRAFIDCPHAGISFKPKSPILFLLQMFDGISKKWMPDNSCRLKTCQGKCFVLIASQFGFKVAAGKMSTSAFFDTVIWQSSNKRMCHHYHFKEDGKYKNAELCIRCSVDRF